MGWLLSDEQTDAAMERMRRARALFRERKYEECLALFAAGRAGRRRDAAAVLNRGGSACRADASGRDYFPAKELAGRALEWNRKSLYASAQVQTGALDVLARIAILEKNPDEAVERYKACYLEGQNTVRYHFTMARFHLQQEHIQAAEREIWSIAELPEASRAEYLILRGKIAAKREQYEMLRSIFIRRRKFRLEGCSSESSTKA